MNLFVKKEDGVNETFIVEKQNQIFETNNYMDEMVIKDEPLEDDLVSYHNIT